MNRKKTEFGADDEQETKSKKIAAPLKNRKKPGRPTKKVTDRFTLQSKLVFIYIVFRLIFIYYIAGSE